MPKFTALLYLDQVDPQQLERTLQSLRVSNDILLINGERDASLKKIAHRYWARVKNGIPGVTPGAFLMDAFYDWILVVRPFEVLNGELMHALLEWRARKRDESAGYALTVNKIDGKRLTSQPPELRLVNRRLINWTGELPTNSKAPVLPGALLRYEDEAAEERLAS